jgi:hypothetical protein
MAVVAPVRRDRSAEGALRMDWLGRARPSWICGYRRGLFNELAGGSIKKR